MTITTENLPAELLQQFDQIVNNPSQSVKTNNQEYIILNLGVTVLVEMTRFPNPDPNRRFLLNPGKLCQDKVKVNVSPPNADVVKVISTHFKNQVMPSIITQPERNVFDEVIVNNEKIV